MAHLPTHSPSDAQHITLCASSALPFVQQPLTFSDTIDNVNRIAKKEQNIVIVRDAQRLEGSLLVFVFCRFEFESINPWY
jgi:hypothetical protein